MFLHFVHWPDWESMRILTLKCFLRSSFTNRVAVIIDCFEIGMERPSSLKAKIKTFSHYKHKNTLKYLLGMTHHGHLSLIHI